jgi:hypothetical protein
LNPFAAAAGILFFSAGLFLAVYAGFLLHRMAQEAAIRWEWLANRWRENWEQEVRMCERIVRRVNAVVNWLLILSVTCFGSAALTVAYSFMAFSFKVPRAAERTEQVGPSASSSPTPRAP